MDPKQDRIVIHATVEISTKALQTIVHNAKQAVGPDKKGHYRVDTADKVSELISLFLAEKGFDDYVADVALYRS